MFKKTAIAAVLGAALSPALGSAAEEAAAPAPTPEHTFTGNVGLFSQYIFRGLTQTNRDPAVQGGFDYAHKSGFYAGTWASNISWLRENATTMVAGAPFVQGTYNEGGSLEWDFYGGYKGTVGDFGYDIGTLYYWYPGKINPAIVAANSPFAVPKAHTWEGYLGGSWKWFSAKVSYSLMNETFGVADSNGTIYLDLTASMPLGDFYKPLNGFTFLAHWGWQKYRGTDPRNFFFRGSYAGRTPDNDELFSYKDAKVGLSYALPKDFTIGAFWSKTFDDNFLGYGSVNQVDVAGNRGPFPRELGKSTGTVYIQKTF